MESVCGLLSYIVGIPKLIITTARAEKRPKTKAKPDLRFSSLFCYTLCGILDNLFIYIRLPPFPEMAEEVAVCIKQNMKTAMLLYTIMTGSEESEV